MPMQQWNEYELDGRSLEDLRNRVKELSESYTPEWNFDRKDPDIGSVVALLFTAQMEENRKQYNMLLKRYRVELANMLGVSLHPATPAQTVVVMENTQMMQGGVVVKRGTKLLGEDAEGNDVIFETEKDVYIANTRLTELLEISGIHKKIVLLWEEGGNFPVPLFSFAGASSDREELIIRHTMIENAWRNGIVLRFEGRTGTERLAELFTDREKYQFLFRKNNQEYPFRYMRTENGNIHLDGLAFRPNELCEEIQEEDITEIVLRSLESGNREIELSSLSLLGDADTLKPSFVYDGRTDLDGDAFYPFGHEIMAYAECYVGQKQAFSQKGAKISISFSLSFENRKLQFVVPDDDLRIIKRSPKSAYRQNWANCSIQELAVEYFNGTGWKKLACEVDYKTIFAAETNAGEHVLRFEAPSDWESMVMGSFEGPCLRLSIVRADNCYLRPGIHICPVLHNMEITYSYEEQKLMPQELIRNCGGKTENLTPYLLRKNFCAFKPFPYENNSLYLGFAETWEDGPVSLYFEMKSDNHFQGSLFRYEYSGTNGFKPLKVVDHTEGFRHTGTLLFQPPEDMKRLEVEGRYRYWIRITEEEGVFNPKKHPFPILKDFHANGVEVRNVETREMQEYFIDTAAAGMRFPLYAENILDAEVWVNEKEQYPEVRMNQLLAEDPENTQAEYNFLGQIEEFYRKWNETANFEDCKNGARSYRIDRMRNQIVFGDGVRTAIPTNTTGTAFKVRVRCCVGSRGNVEAEKITSFMGNMMFVEQIYNSVSAYGGNDLEKLIHALKRSSNLISGRKRLVSEQDFLSEAMAYSDTVSQAKCLAENGNITLVLLMKDYRKGSYSFRSLEPLLRKHIMSGCEAVLSEGQLQIVEPLYAAVSLDVWLVAENLADAFSVRNNWMETIENFLEPVEGSRHSGWKIGSMPNENQIRMMLKSMEKKIRVEKYSITVIYRNEEGVHETSLRELAGNPVVVCCNGTHHIHMRKKEG